MRTTFLAIGFGLVASLCSLHAGHEVIATAKDGKAMLETSPYDIGKYEFEIGGAGFGSVDTLGTATRPDHNYGLAELRLGIMAYSPKGHGFLRGNTEFLLEAFGGGVGEGPGTFLAGAELLVRYNFVQPHARIVPYLQIGAGGVYSDAAYLDRIQHLIGSDLSFNLQAEYGLRFMVSDKVAITGGFEYRHISNADTASRNRGLNSLGGNLSLSLFF